jgi:hypothetical protein
MFVISFSCSYPNRFLFPHTVLTICQLRLSFSVNSYCTPLRYLRIYCQISKVRLSLHFGLIVFCLFEAKEREIDVCTFPQLISISYKHTCVPMLKHISHIPIAGGKLKNKFCRSVSPFPSLTVNVYYSIFLRSKFLRYKQRKGIYY